MRIVRRELRINPVGHTQQFPRDRDIGHVRCGLGRKDRKAVQSRHLRALDFGVPIGALDQTHHDLAVQSRGQIVQPVNHVCGALSVGLNHHAEPVPTGQRGIGKNRFDHIQRNGQAVRLFRIDVQPDASLRGLDAERAETGGQLLFHKIALQNVIARMQRRQFYRNARIFADIVMFCRTRDGADSVPICLEIALGVFVGARRFAQHVVGIGITLGLGPTGALHGRGDGFAQNKLIAHFTHRAGHRRADHRFAQTPDCAAQMADGAFVFVMQNTSRQHQRPSRGVH